MFLKILSRSDGDSVPKIDSSTFDLVMTRKGKGQTLRRKPYTITRPRETWTEEEHDRFIEGLEMFDRDWKRIESHVATKSVIQIRSHAQKYFMKMQKQGKAYKIPPPRPKRKSSHPYPTASSSPDLVEMGQSSFTPSKIYLPPPLSNEGNVFKPLDIPLGETPQFEGLALSWESFDPLQ